MNERLSHKRMVFSSSRLGTIEPSRVGVSNDHTHQDSRFTQ
jgi:hypothetical protein